jgi:hypothetical protein
VSCQLVNTYTNVLEDNNASVTRVKQYEARDSILSVWPVDMV